MKKILLICLINVASLLGQSDFWSHLSFNTPVYQLVNYGDSLLLAVRDIDILKTTDMGLSWANFFTSPCSVSLMEREVANGQIYFIVKQSCVQQPNYISTNSGQDWQELNTPNQSGDFDITSDGSIILFSDTAYYSTDLGNNWNYFNIPTAGELQFIEVNMNDRIYITKRCKLIEQITGWWWYYGTMYYSDDFGQNWVYLGNTSYSFGPAGFGTLFHTHDGEIIASWGHEPVTRYSNMATGDTFPLWLINSAVTINYKYFFASRSTPGDQGINYSANSGQNWVSQNSGLTNLSCYSIIKDQLGYLYVGTNDGIFKSNQSQLALFANPAYEFEDTRIGDTTYLEITLRNPSPINIIVDSISTDIEEFLIPNILNIILEPGDSLNFEVGFNPLHYGVKTSTLNLYSDLIHDKIQLKGASPSPALLELEAPSFDTVPIGDTIFSILAYTSQSLNKITIDTLYLKHEEDFFPENIQFPVELEFADTISFRIFFSPNSLGQRADTIIILSNTTTPQLSKRIFGQGIAPVLLRLVNFGIVSIGDTATSDLKLISRSLSNVMIDYAYLKQGQEFFLENIQFPIEVLPMDTTNIKVYFSPSFVGQRIDTIFVDMNVRNYQISRIVAGQGSNPNNIENEERLVTEYFLSNCYPNPFNPSTTIEYQVPKRSNVHISVFNLLGEEIDILVNEEKENGIFRVDFDGSKLSSGIYFYKMQTEEFTSTKKFILLK